MDLDPERKIKDGNRTGLEKVKCRYCAKEYNKQSYPGHLKTAHKDFSKDLRVYGEPKFSFAPRKASNSDKEPTTRRENSSSATTTTTSSTTTTTTSARAEASTARSGSPENSQEFDRSPAVEANQSGEASPPHPATGQDSGLAGPMGAEEGKEDNIHESLMLDEDSIMQQVDNFFPTRSQSRRSSERSRSPLAKNNCSSGASSGDEKRSRSRIRRNRSRSRPSPERRTLTGNTNRSRSLAKSRSRSNSTRCSTRSRSRSASSLMGGMSPSRFDGMDTQDRRSVQKFVIHLELSLKINMM